MKMKKFILFGFRSQKWYKMIIALLYIGFMILMIVGSLISSDELAVTWQDKFFDKTSSIVLWIVMLSPYLIMSNIFGLREKLPLYRSQKKIPKILACISTLFIGFVVFGLFNSFSDSFLSNEYKIATQERLAQERLAQERLAQEQLAQEQLAQEQLAQEQLAQEQVEEQERQSSTGKNQTEQPIQGSEEEVEVPDEDIEVEEETNEIMQELNNDVLYADFVTACEQIGLNIEEIRRFEQTEDWAQGTRFTFSYSGKTFYLYNNVDTVESINASLTGDTKVYDRGYEPYQIDDYIFDLDKVMFQIYAEDTVKAALNYPSTADFHTMDWAFARDRDLYYVQSNVTAQNAFGVKEEMSFIVVFQKDMNQAVYIQVGGTVYVNNLPEKTERAKIEIGHDTSVNEGQIHITDGVANEYSQENMIDGVVYYKYYVPAGKYSVFAQSKNAMIWIVNADNQVDTSITLAYEETGEITLQEGQFLEVTIGTEVLLTKMQ